MRLHHLVSSVLLRLAAIGGSASGSGVESHLSASAIGSALPIIKEQYIRCQTDGGVTAFSSADLQCNASDPCPDGSHCNSLGQCDYRDVKVAHDVGSKDSSQSCFHDLCCSQFSLCGVSEFFYRNFTASGESLPCQKGFDNCGTVSNKGSGTTSRWTSYYEGWNTCRQPCAKVWPAQIDTTAVKQIVFSFATIDPNTFAVGPMHPDDEKLYADLLNLKDTSQKWIGIGGWKLPDAGPTHQTWTLIASSKANRSAFTSSLLDFLHKWDFAGVDINWEWHGADTLGGDAAIVKRNLIDLVKELRTALGSRGLSVVLSAHLDHGPCTDGSHVEARAHQQDPPTPGTLSTSTAWSAIAVSSESVVSSTASTVSSIQALSAKSVETSTTSTMSLDLLSAEPALLSLQPWSAATTTSDSPVASWYAKSSPAGTPEAMPWPTQTSAWSRSTMSLDVPALSSDMFVSAALFNSTWSVPLSLHIHRSTNTSTHVPAHQTPHIHLSSTLDTIDSWLSSSSPNQTSMWISTMSTETGGASDSPVKTWPTITSGPLFSLTQIGNMSNTTTTANGTVPPIVPPVQAPPVIPPWVIPIIPPIIPPKGRPSLTCLEKDRTTVTDRYITCFEDLLVSPTSSMSSTSTYTSTITTRTESCITREESSTDCGISSFASTTTTTSFTTASQAPACTRAQLDMNNDEGDNPQPPRDSCDRSPLNLDDDEGDNEHPEASCPRSPLLLDDDEGDNSQPEAPSCTRAPLSLDDDEGNNEMPEDTSPWNPWNPENSTIPAPPSTLSESATAPWGTGIPTGTPCQACDKHFNDCTKWRCRADGSDADQCAKFCLTSVCYDSTSPGLCKTGACRPPACPKNPPVNYETADPAGGFTTVLGLPSKTTTVTAFPTGSIIPNCPTCDNVFAECVKTSCLQDGSKPDECAKRCMAYLCYGDHNAPLCKKGFCRPAACPVQTPVDYNTAQPGHPFTTVLSFPSTTITVTPTPTYGEPTLKHGPTPTCNAGHGTTPNGKWTMLFEHKIHEQPANATFKWDLWDEDGCHAGDGMAWNQYLGYNITASIGTPTRDMYKMNYELLTDVTDSFSRAESEIHFQISQPVGGCKSTTKRDTPQNTTAQGKIDAPPSSDQDVLLNPNMGIVGPVILISSKSDSAPAPTFAPTALPKPKGCYAEFKVNNREPDISWQIVNDCAQQCSSQKLTTNDVRCDSGINKWQDNGDNPVSVRGGLCTFSMPFSTGNAVSDPSKWDRKSRWTLELVQNMEYVTASIEWLLKDPDDNVAAHQIQDLSGPKEHKVMIDVDSDTPEAARMRYKMLMTITEPRDKDITQLKLTYQNDKNAWCDDDCGQGPRLIDTCAIGALTPCRPWYQTETPNEKKQSLLDVCYDEGKKKPCFSPMIYSNWDFSCDPVIDKWRPKNAGFERRFNCWWPYDFAVPYGLTDRPPNFKGSVDDNSDGFNDLTGATGLMPDHGSANGSWSNATWR